LALPEIADQVAETFQTQLLVFDGEGRRELMNQGRDVRVTGDAVTARHGLELALRVALRPGRYNLRLGVTRASSKAAGTVHATVVVPDFAADPLALSGVVVGRIESPAAAGREAIADLLPFSPTTVRAFAPTDRVGMLLRVHQGQNGKAPVQLATEVVDGAGRVVFADTRTFEPKEFDGGRGVEHRFQPALSTLGAGPFLVRFVATAGGHRVQRDVQFRIAADLPKM